jgi:NADH-quinone oxidoreductase subunit M
MQSAFRHHHFWTALATTGVILSAAYMLSMIQRIFYCDLGPKPRKIGPHDLDAREHLALWPMVALFLIMGVASPIWLKAIDPVAVALADHAATGRAARLHHEFTFDGRPAATHSIPGGAR